MFSSGESQSTKKEQDGEEEDDGQRDLTAVVPRRVRAIPRASLSRSIGQLHPSERVVRSHKTVSRPTCANQSR